MEDKNLLSGYIAMFMENYNLAQVFTFQRVQLTCMYVLLSMVLTELVLSTLGIIYGFNESFSCFRGKDAFSSLFLLHASK